jgi:hypothetical protein
MVKINPDQKLSPNTGILIHDLFKLVWVCENHCGVFIEIILKGRAPIICYESIFIISFRSFSGDLYICFVFICFIKIFKRFWILLQPEKKHLTIKKIASFFLNCLVRFTHDPRPLFRLFRLRKMIRASHPSGLRPCSNNLMNRPLANLAPESYRCHACVQLFFFKSNGC